MKLSQLAVEWENTESNENERKTICVHKTDETDFFLFWLARAQLIEKILTVVS